MLTSAMRIKVLPLTLQTEPQISPIQELAKNKIPIPKSSLLLFDSDDVPAYLSLLEDEPYEVPPLLARSSGLPSNPLLSLPRPEGTIGEFRLTPDSLRFLAATVESLAGQIHDITVEYRSSDLRAQLQKQELLRQQQKCKEIFDLINSLRGERQAATKEKVAKLQETQRALLAREDRILASLMKKASPELSESETKWFQELKRMRAEIKGSTRYDQESLSARTNLVGLYCVCRISVH